MKYLISTVAEFEELSESVGTALGLSYWGGDSKGTKHPFYTVQHPATGTIAIAIDAHEDYLTDEQVSALKDQAYMDSNGWFDYEIPYS